MFILMWIVIVGAGGFFVYDFFFNKSREKYWVRYGKLNGDKIVFDPVTYQGYKNKDGDLFVPKLKLSRPMPEYDLFELTNSKYPLVDLVNIGEDRYIYRKSVMDNEVYTYEYNEHGKIKINEKTHKPIIKKKKWQICDDYVEQNVKHWERLRNQELFEKYKKKSKLDEWKPLIAIGVAFVVFLVAMKFMSDNWKNHLQAMQGEMDERTAEVDRILGAVEGFTNKDKAIEPAGENPTSKKSGGG